MSTAMDRGADQGQVVPATCPMATVDWARWLQGGGGAALVAWGLSRRSATGLAAAGAGGYLLYRALRGVVRWPGRGAGEQGHWPQHHGHSDSVALPSDTATRDWYPAEGADLVDEASMNSFPASDVPSYMSGPATPTARADDAAGDRTP